MSEYTTFSCRHCKKKPKGLGKRQKSIHKRRSDEFLYKMAKDEIIRLKNRKRFTVTAEDIAEKFQVKVCRIKKVFMKLNQEGILGKRVNSPPHDCIRDKNGWGHDRSWCASTYLLYFRSRG